MKTILYMILISLVTVAEVQAQQCLTLSKSCSYESDPIGLMGVGTVNSESLSKANSSGKLTGYARLYEKYDIPNIQTLTIYMSFNKNITRTDSFSIRSLLFPDLGNNTFDATVEFSKRLDHQKTDEYEIGHYIVPFAEGWIKDFKVGKTDSTFNRFVTTNATLGLKYVYHYGKKKQTEKAAADTETENESDAYFSISAFYTHNNILKKDDADYYKITTGESTTRLPLKYNSFGVKVALEYNKFQFFIDMRHVLGNAPNRDMRGFCYNIGFVTTAAFLSKN